MTDNNLSFQKVETSNHSKNGATPKSHTSREIKKDKIMKTGIEIKTGFFPLAWFLYFVTPTIEINSEKHKKSWGTTFFPLSPGEYKVKISFPYMGKSECGANEINVTLSEGQTKKIVYNMPPWMLAKGSIKMA